MGFEQKKEQKKFPLALDIQFFSDGGGEGAKDIKALQGEFQKSWSDLKGLLDTQTQEIKNFGETNQKTADQIKSVEDRIKTIDTEFKGIQEKQTDLEKQISRGAFLGGQGEQMKSIGQKFIESDAYKNMVKSGSRNTEPVLVKSFFPSRTKDLDSTDANGGVLSPSVRVPEIIAPPERTLRLRDVLRVQPTTSSAIEYIQETGFTNNAGTVAEKILKPQSDITFEMKTAGIKTLAHWIPATRQILSDATQLQGYVENRLEYGLKLVEETQVLYGDGVGENILGIMTNTGIQDMGSRVTNADGTAKADPDTRLDFIRKAITRSVLAGYPVTAIVMHPADWEDIELAKGTDGHYIWVNVTTGGQPRLWAVPVVESLSMVEGEFLLGAFGLGATLYDREDSTIRVSEHHSDFFLRNQVAILCEERVGLATFRPESFVRGVLA